MLEYEKQRWESIETVGDFLDFIDDPKIDVLDWMSNNVNWDKSGFWVAANVKFDFDITELVEKQPEIASTEVSTLSRVPSELEHHKKFKFTNGYDRHRIDDNLRKIVKALGFEEGYAATMNNQPPATLMHRHVDFLGCWYYDQQRDQPFDKDTRQPRGSKPVYRCFVALDDWHPGQMISMEPDFWSNWKKGDVLFFDWRNTPHSTANCGIHNRPLLKITGTVDDDSYIQESKQTGIVARQVYIN